MALEEKTFTWRQYSSLIDSSLLVHLGVQSKLGLEIWVQTLFA
jgi:hypothetical protein